MVGAGAHARQSIRLKTAKKGGEERKEKVGSSLYLVSVWFNSDGTKLALSGADWEAGNIWKTAQREIRTGERRKTALLVRLGNTEQLRSKFRV